MKLYYAPGACSLAAHIVLEWIGKPYELHKVTIYPEKSPELIKLNPMGAVPVIEDGGWVLTQNSAILNYLAESSPGSRLDGDGTPRGRAEVNRWVGFVNSDMHPAFKPLFGSTAYLGHANIIETSKQEARARLRHLLQVVGGRLEGRDWIAGTRSIADPYFFVMLRWAKQQSLDLSDLTALERFYGHMQADEGVKKALQQEAAGG